MEGTDKSCKVESCDTGKDKLKLVLVCLPEEELLLSRGCGSACS